MIYDVIFRADRAVIDGAERPAAVAVRDGRVAEIAERDAPLEAAHTVELGADEVLLPGMVDAHVHVNEPGRTDWEGFSTATRAALKGGTTTIIDMPLNSLPPTTSVSAFEEKKSAAEGQCFVDVGFWGGAIPGNIDDLLPLHDEGVFGFKCFLLDSGVPEFPPLSPAELRENLRRTALIGALMIIHAESAAEIDAAPHVVGARYADFVAGRPDASEVTAIQLVIDTMRETGARAHILHLSSSEALPLIRAAKAEGLPLTVETCPHYLTFTAEAIVDGSTAHKCCPPIRSSANQDKLWAALADGTIDCIVSDHSPSTKDLKTPDFDSAWGGVSSVQVALSAVWSGARERGHTLVDVVRWMSEGPARTAGVTDKGGIRVGGDADLLAYAPDDVQRIDAATLEHKNKITAYDGLELTGVARRVWLRGQEISTDRPSGRFLVRGDR